MTTILGLVAGVLTTGCWLPQLRRSWRTGSTGDISWVYLSVLSLGVALWLLYGLVSGDLAVSLANGATLAALLALAGLKLSHQRTALLTAGGDGQPG